MSLTLILILFFIMDPLGNLTSFLHMVKGLDPKRQRFIVFREMLIALAAMVLFYFVGEILFKVLKISEPTVKIASGVILFLIAIKILFLSPTSLRANLSEGEPFIIPLAIPLIAGPALLATIMLYAKTEPNLLIMLPSIFIAWLLSVIILLLAPRLQYYLGNNGLMACERLTGMILVMLSIQRFLEGVQQFIPMYCIPK